MTAGFIVGQLIHLAIFVFAVVILWPYLRKNPTK